MQKFSFDMKDGVPFRDRVGIEFQTMPPRSLIAGFWLSTFTETAQPTIKTLRYPSSTRSAVRFIGSSFIGDSGLLGSRFANAGGSINSGFRA